MRRFFEGQWLHALVLLVLLAGVQLAGGADAVRAGSLWGISSTAWLWIAVAAAIAHQVMVWLVWRAELHFGAVSRTFGPVGFTLYAGAFAVLGIGRLVAVVLVAIANAGTLEWPTTPLRVGAVALLLPAIYLFYSVRRYFGFRRALGADHFDPAYRSMPFVRKGIFRFTSNGMYVYGFFVVWVPGLWWASVGALVAAAFNHTYIWVHYGATERPDMRRIYGPR